MAKKNNNKTDEKTTKSSGQSKKSKETKETKKGRSTSTVDSGSGLNLTNGIGRKELFSFSFGFILVVFAVFLLVAFCSYLYTGDKDFSMLENTSAQDWENADYRFSNVCGVIGAKIAYFFLNNCFGLASFLIIPFLVVLGFSMMRVYKVRMIKKFIMGTFIMVWASVALSTVSHFIPFMDNSFLNLGGNHGKKVVKFLTQFIGEPGLFGVLVITAVLFLVYVSVRTIEVVRAFFRASYIRKIRLGSLRKNKELEEEETEDEDGNEGEDNNAESQNVDENEVFASPAVSAEASEQLSETSASNVLEFHITNEDVTNEEMSEGETDLTGDNEQGAAETPVEDPADAFSRISGELGNVVDDGDDDNDGEEVSFDVTANETEKGSGEIERGDINTPYDPKMDLENYQYPDLSLIPSIEGSNVMIDVAEQNANKDRITQVLRNFGVEITTIKATIGPTITLYEIIPVEGTRISKIRNLEDDIALSLAAEGIRIIAPIPGKGTIGIEVPNRKKCVVSMESVLNSKAYQESTMELPCAVGKTITNDVFMFDLAKAPHLLVAGATGQGKSVGLNAIIASLLYKKHPAELKIVMVDPKKVEFSIYSPIENHFLARLEDEEECIITDVQKVVKTLTSLCQLMDTRYDLLKKAGCRNIKEYNAKFKERKLNPENGHEFMPYIVVVVDEFGDLIMTAGKEVELPICRIAQLARAVGIHMIIATQRPQASIISGAIKTNFPARMAFKVSSMMDSRVVLDRPGAQQLIGRGDMLFLAGSDPVRVQCAFLDTPEVSNICQFIARQQGYLHPLFLPEVLGEDGDGGGASSVDVKHLDPMFGDVAKFVVANQSGSTSMIQRNYSIGYNRAGKIMDQLEKMGVVGPQIGSKPREVIIKDPVTLENLLSSIG